MNMRNPFYIRQLKRDIKVWIEQGILSPHDADEMLATAGSGGNKKSLSGILAMLGVIMLGFAAMSYIAANFWAIPRTTLLALIIGLMWAAYASGCYYLSRDKAGAGNAAITLGVLLFGVNIMLIAQMYHISSHYPDGVMAWAIGALAIAIVTPSRPALVIAYTLGALWTSMESLDFGVSFHWPYLVFWAIAFIHSHFLKWRLGFHLGFLSLIYWLSLNTIDQADRLGWEEAEIITLYALLWLCVWVKGCYSSSIGYAYGQAAARYGILLFYVAYFIMHVADESYGSYDATASTVSYVLAGIALIFTFLNWKRESFNLTDVSAHVIIIASILAIPFIGFSEMIPLQWFYSGLYLMTAIWFLSIGAKYNETFMINTSLIAFGAEVLYIYFKTFDSLLGQSAFFAVGGLFLVAMSFGLGALRKHLTQTDDPSNSSSTDDDEGATEGEGEKS